MENPDDGDPGWDRMNGMRRPGPIPDQLAGHALTPGRLSREGIHAERLYREDVVRISWGVHRQVPELPLSVEERALALGESLSDVCLSHATAAACLGLWLPPEVRDDPRIHLTQPAGTTRRIRRPETVGHRRPLNPEDVVSIGEVRVTSPARTWFDLAASCSVRSLVMLGDHLVRKPRPRFEARHEPHATITELQRNIDRAGKVKGKTRARGAVEMVRIGADSVRETALRLAIVEAGLPEPQLQVLADPSLPFSHPADMGYPGLKIAIQYDGETHFTPERARWDQARNNAFLSQGWLLLLFNGDDARDGFRRSVAQVRAAIHTRTS